MATSTRSPGTILHAFSSFEMGGAQSRVVTLMNAYGGDFRHLVLAMDGNLQASARLQAGVDWQHVPFTPIRGGAWANRDACRDLLRRLRPDLLVTYNWGAIEWALADRPRLMPHVHVEDGFGPGEARAQLPRRVWFRRAVLATGHAQVVVPSRRLWSCARDWWLPRSRLRYIPNGVEVPADTRISAAPSRGAEITIGTVAGLRPEKNVGRLIRAFAELQRSLPTRRFKLLVIGDGPQRQELERLAASESLSAAVEFTGYLSRPQTRLKSIDLFALSSDTEQQPISMMEAMAHGLPVIATAVGDVPHILPSSTVQRQVCPPDDAAFTRLLKTSIEAADEWPNWAEAGLDRVRRQYSVDAMSSRWRLVYEGRAQAVPDLLAAGGDA